MDIAGWRNRIDELDRKLVELLNERARAAQQIGALKRSTQAPIYEPERERQIFENVKRANRGPLPDRELAQIYERLIDVMRKIQKPIIAGEDTARGAAAAGGTELDVNE